MIFHQKTCALILRFVSVLYAHNVRDPVVNLFLYDEYKSAIGIEDLPIVLKQFSGCSHFFLEFVVVIIFSQSCQVSVDLHNNMKTKNITSNFFQRNSSTT